MGCHKLKLFIAMVTLCLAIFDMGTDWWAFKDFVLYDGGRLTYALAIFCIIATILFVLEIRNGIYAFLVHRGADTGKDEIAMVEIGTKVKVKHRPVDKAEKNLNLWQEIVSFLLLAFEDLPVIIILYVAFNKGSCVLFIRIFEESITANLSLLGILVSSLWKIILSMTFCCCRCLNCYDIETKKKKFGCCLCRMLRPLLAIILMGFAAYLFFTFNSRGISSRPDCVELYRNISRG